MAAQEPFQPSSREPRRRSCHWRPRGVTAGTDGDRRADAQAGALTAGRLPRLPPFVGSGTAPRALAEAVPRPCLPVRGGEAPFRRDASHCALSRFLPTYTFQMLFVLPASHGLRPSDKLVLWTYVVAIMGMLTPHSLPAGARQLAPRPGAWHAPFSATRGSLPRPRDSAHAQASCRGLCGRCPLAWNAGPAASSPRYSFTRVSEGAASRKPSLTAFYRGRNGGPKREGKRAKARAWFSARGPCAGPSPCAALEGETGGRPALCLQTWQLPASRRLRSWTVLEGGAQHPWGGEAQERGLRR